MGGRGETWLELVGRGHGDQARARVLNLDIGGGTTDVTIVECPGPARGRGRRPGRHRALPQQQHHCRRRPGATDSRIGPPPGHGAGPGPQSPARLRLLGRQKGEDRARWNRITRQVFLPIAHGWLAAAAREDSGPTHADAPAIAREPALNRGIQRPLPKCRRAGPLAGAGHRPGCSPTGWRRASARTSRGSSARWRRWWRPSMFGLVLVSGKPSELAALRNLLRAELPLLPQRILFTKDAFRRGMVSVECRWPDS